MRRSLLRRTRCIHTAPKLAVKTHHIMVNMATINRKSLAGYTWYELASENTSWLMQAQRHRGASLADTVARPACRNFFADITAKRTPVASNLNRTKICKTRRLDRHTEHSLSMPRLAVLPRQARSRPWRVRARPGSGFSRHAPRADCGASSVDAR